MITPMFMYLFTRLDSVNALFQFGVIVIAMALILGLFLCLIAEKTEFYMRHYKKCMIALVCSGVALVLLPSQKEAAAIYLVPKIINNEKLQGIAGNMLGILEKQTVLYLESLILTEDNKKGGN